MEERPQLAAQLLAGGRIERGEGLVEQEEPGPRSERTGQGDALPLPPGEPGRSPVEKGLDPEESRRLDDPPAPLFPGQATQPEGDVAPRREVREEREVLEDEPHPAELRWDVDPGRGVEPDIAPEGDGTGVGPVEPGHGAEQRRLPRPGRAEEDENASGRERLVERGADPGPPGERAAHVDRDLPGHPSTGRRRSE